MISRLIFISILIKIALGQAVFVAVGADVTPNNGRNIAYSLDGINWTILLTSIFSDSVEGIAYSASQNKWIAVGQGTVNTMAWSPDGIRWIGLGLNCFDVIGKGIAYSSQQNRWVAVGNGPNSICYSTDGFSWTMATSGIFASLTIAVEGRSVVYSSTLNQWVAVGHGANSIATSPDGITWTGLGSIIFVNGGNSVRYANGVYVVAGSGTVTQAWSANGINWMGTPEFIGASREDSVYAQGRWILVGPSSITFQNSTDGKSWTNKQNFAGILHVRGITYNTAYNRYVAVGIGANTIVYSSDGDNWNGAGALFNNWASKVATTGFFAQIILNPSPIPRSIANLVTNTSIINNNTVIVVSGNLTIIGDLAIDGTWILGAASSVNISGLLKIKGNTTFNSQKPIGCNTLFISSAIGDSTLEVSLTTNLTIGNSISFPVVTYTDRVGIFSAITVRSASTVTLSPDDCPVATQDYSSTTLSVTVTMTSCQAPGIEMFATNSMPKEMIIGIAVGCAVFAAAIILVVVLLMRRHRDRADAIANLNLRQASINDLKVAQNRHTPVPE